MVKGRDAAKSIVGEIMGERHLFDDSSGEIVSARVLCAQRCWLLSRSVGICAGFYTSAILRREPRMFGTSTIILEPSGVPVRRQISISKNVRLRLNRGLSYNKLRVNSTTT